MDKDLKSSFASEETSVLLNATLHSLLPLPSDFDSSPSNNNYHYNASPPSFSLFSQHFTSQTLKIPKNETLTHDEASLFNNNINNNPQTSNLSNPSRKNKRKIERQTMSDKFRSLQKLMPWDKRMDTATMLGEAYYYIKFLKAQINALQMMPFFFNDSTVSSNSSDNYVCPLGSAFGAMGMLTRQQLLQVLLNTPEAQTRLYSQRCCVFTIEQLLAFKEVAERRRVEYQLMMLNQTPLID